MMALLPPSTMDFHEINVGDHIYLGRPHHAIAKVEVLKKMRTRIEVELLEEYVDRQIGTVLKTTPKLCYATRPEEKTYQDLVEEAETTIQKRCSLSSPPHWIANPSSYLTGASLNKTGRERDQQRKCVYQAEQQVDIDTYAFDKFEDAKAYTKQLRQYPWFAHRFGSLEDLTVRACREDARRSRATTSEVALANFRIWTILHEISHVLTPKPHPAHGPLFARILMELVEHILEVDLKSSYIEHGVQYYAGHRQRSAL